MPGLTLENCREVKPYLIKPNLDELAEMFHEEINMENYRTYADKLVEMGVENVLVSLGGEGSCGDTMLGCTIACLSRGYPLEKALKYGEAAGRAKARMRGLPKEGDISSIYGLVTVNKIS